MAAKFTRKLGKRLLKELPDDIPEGRLKAAFECAINSLPKKDLRKELKHDLKKYLNTLEKIMKKHGKLVSKKSKSGARGTLDEELVQSERRGCIEMGETSDKPTEKTAHISPFQWLTKVKSLLKKPGTYDTVRETLQTLLDESETDVTHCIEKEKPNRSRKLAQEIKNIVSACYLKLQMNNIQHAKSKVHHLLSALLSIYLDLSSIYCIKKVEKKKIYGREIGSYVQYILHEKPEDLLEVVLQSTYVNQPETKFLNPFIKQCILDQPAHHSHQHYLKHVLVIQKVQKKFDDTTAAELVVHGKNLKPLDGFYGWLEMKCPKALKLIILKKKKSFADTKISSNIISVCSEEVITLLQDSLCADMDDASIHEDKDTEVTGLLDEEEVSDVQIEQSDALFFIDKSKPASGKLLKKTKKQNEMQKKKTPAKGITRSKEVISKRTDTREVVEKEVVQTRSNKTSNAGVWIESTPKETSVISSETVIQPDSEVDEDSNEEGDGITSLDIYKEKVIETSPDSDEEKDVEISPDSAEKLVANVEKDEVNSDESMDTEETEMNVADESAENGSQNSPVNIDTETDVSLKNDGIEQNIKANVSDNVFFSESDPDTSIDLKVKSVVLKVIRGSSGEKVVESHQESSKHSKVVKSNKAKSNDQSVGFSRNSDGGDFLEGLTLKSKEKNKKDSSIGTLASAKKRKKTSEDEENITEDACFEIEHGPSHKVKNQQGSRTKSNLASPGKKKASARVTEISEMEDKVEDSETLENETAGPTPLKKKRRSHSKDMYADTEQFSSSTEKNRQGHRTETNNSTPGKMKANVKVSEVDEMKGEHKHEDSGTQDHATNEPTPKRKRRSHSKDEGDNASNLSKSNEDIISEKDITTPSKLQNLTSEEAKQSSVKKRIKSTPASHKKGVQLNDDLDVGAQPREKLDKDMRLSEDCISPKEKSSRQLGITEFLEKANSGDKIETSSNSEKENETPKRSKRNSTNEKRKTPSHENKEVDKGNYTGDRKKRKSLATSDADEEEAITVESKQSGVKATWKLIVDEGKADFSPKKETINKKVLLEDESIIIDSSDTEDNLADMTNKENNSVSEIPELKTDEVDSKVDDAVQVHDLHMAETADKEKTTQDEDSPGNGNTSSEEKILTDSLRNKSIVIPSEDSDSEPSDIPNLEKHMKPEIFFAEKLTLPLISRGNFADENLKEFEIDDDDEAMGKGTEDANKSVKPNDIISVDEDTESSIDNNSHLPEISSPRLRSHSKAVDRNVERNVIDGDTVISNTEAIHDKEKSSHESAGRKTNSPEKRSRVQDVAVSEIKISRNAKVSSPTKTVAGKMEDIHEKSPVQKERMLRSSSYKSPKVEICHEGNINKSQVEDLETEEEKESQLHIIADEQEDGSKPKDQKSVEPVKENEAETDAPSDTEPDDKSDVEEIRPTRRSSRVRKSVTVEDSDNESVCEKQTKQTRSRSAKKNETEVPAVTSTVREIRRSTRSKPGSDLQSESETGESDTDTRRHTRRSVHFKNQMEAIEEQNEKKTDKDKVSSKTPVGKQRPRVLSASTSKKEAKKVEEKKTLRKRRLSAEFSEANNAASGPESETSKKTTPSKKSERSKANPSPKLKTLPRRTSLRKK